MYTGPGRRFRGCGGALRVRELRTRRTTVFQPRRCRLWAEWWELRPHCPHIRGPGVNGPRPRRSGSRRGRGVWLPLTDRGVKPSHAPRLPSDSTLVKRVAVGSRPSLLVYLEDKGGSSGSSSMFLATSLRLKGDLERSESSNGAPVFLLPARRSAGCLSRGLTLTWAWLAAYGPGPGVWATQSDVPPQSGRGRGGRRITVRTPEEAASARSSRSRSVVTRQGDRVAVGRG